MRIREDELLEQLAEEGLNCKLIDTGSDHYVLEIKGRWNSEKV